jgi:RNA polymerase sigma-70 factor (ECF subfamily)
VFLSTSDDDLIRLAQSGHRPAFEMLVQRTSRLVWAHLQLQTGDRSLTEDLVQETYLRAWRAMSTLQSVETFRPWLLSIADRIRIDEHRHATRRKRGSPTSLDDEPAAADGGPSPPQAAEQTEQRERALVALRELPEQYRMALSLRYLGGADYEEMSRQLALTNGSLRGLLHRGLEMLREKLKEK